MSSESGRVPAWLAALGIQPGEYFCDSKARWRRAMKARCFSPAARIYACLALHTAGFQQELAVKPEHGKKVPLRPEDVCEMTGISRKHFREHMDELRRDGLAELKGVTKGTVQMYAWAVPRPVQVEENCPVARDNFEAIPGLSQELISTLKRYKFKPDPEHCPVARDIAELEELDRAYRAAELSLREKINSLRAGRIYKDERLEREERETTHTHEHVAQDGNGVCVSPPLSAVAPEPEPPAVLEAEIVPPEVKSTNRTPETNGNGHKPATALVPRFDPAPSFLVFWNTYKPWRDGQEGSAARWWATHVTTGSYAAEIIEGLNRHVNSQDWSQHTAIPYALKFLQEHWYRRRPRPKLLSKREQTTSEAIQILRSMEGRK